MTCKIPVSHILFNYVMKYPLQMCLINNTTQVLFFESILALPKIAVVSIQDSITGPRPSFLVSSFPGQDSLPSL